MKNCLNISTFSFLFFLSCNKKNSVENMKPIFIVETNDKIDRKVEAPQGSKAAKLKNDDSYTPKNNISYQLI